MQSHVSHHSEITGGKSFSQWDLRIFIKFGVFLLVIFVAKVRDDVLPSRYLSDFCGYWQV